MFTYLTVSVLSVNIGDSVSASNSVGSSLNTQDFSIKDSLGRVRLKMGLSCSPWTIPLSKCALAIFYCGLTMKNVYISMSLLRMCSAEINWSILRILLYLAHARGRFVRERKPRPFYNFACHRLPSNNKTGKDKSHLRFLDISDGQTVYAKPSIGFRHRNFNLAYFEQQQFLAKKYSLKIFLSH